MLGAQLEARSLESDLWHVAAPRSSLGSHASEAGPVVVATDLTDAARPALVQGKAHAAAIGAPLIVCHVIHDVFRNHPLIPNPAENELMLGAALISRAADLVADQIERELGPSGDAAQIAVESGSPEEEIVRIAEARSASLIVVGAKPRHGAQLVLGHVAERVVRYAHAAVLVAREGTTTGRVLVPTDFTEGSRTALAIARAFAQSTGAEVTLLHVVKPMSSVLSSALMPLGDTWSPPPKAAMERLEALGLATLESLATEHGFARFEQLEGDPADVVIERAAALDVDVVIMGSRGRRGLARLVLGSVAEKVIRNSHCSVLVARDAAPDGGR